MQAAVRQQRQAKRAAEAQRVARQAARKQDKKLMQQLKAAKGAWDVVGVYGLLILFTP